MIVGFNTDIKYRGESFHVQTEDKGQANPVIETLVYLHGEILVSRKVSYAHLVDKEDLVKLIKKMMQVQHDQVIKELRGGGFAHLISLETQNLEERTLDDLILEYLENKPGQ